MLVYAIFACSFAGFSVFFMRFFDVFYVVFSQKSARIFASFSALLCVRSVRGSRNFDVQ